MATRKIVLFGGRLRFMEGGREGVACGRKRWGSHHRGCLTIALYGECPGPRALCAINSCQRSIGETLQDGAVAIVERVWSGRKNFQQADHSFPETDRDCDDGSNAQQTATLAIHTEIRFGIIAALEKSSARAIS